MTEMRAPNRGPHNGAWARRHNHALVALARRVWHEDCTLADACAAICETAAQTLEVERVNIWRFDDDSDVLRCVHGYVRSGAQHNPPGYDEAIAAVGRYRAELGEVRVIDAGDVSSSAIVSASQQAIGDYLRRHRVQSLLDAPVRSEGRLVGVVCHEQVGAARVWTPEDEAFAGSIGDYMAMAWETHRRREAESRLRHLERHDPRTDLPNRDHLLEVAHAALRPLRGDTAGLAVIHLRLNLLMQGDEIANDTAAPMAVAARLREEFGEVATLARVRSDGFALLPHRQLHETDALQLAERCVDLVRASAGASGLPPAAVSAGIAFSRDLPAPSAEALLRNAELASQHADTGERGRCGIFDAEQHRGLLSRMRSGEALRAAFAEGRMRVHFQPEVDLHDGRWCAAEALLRWCDEEGRVRSAGEFIGVAESTGLIVPLGCWVLAQACRVATTWPARAGQAPLLRVNVSARQFEQPGLVDEVAQVLASSGLPSSRLCLELTETALLGDPATAARTLSRLRALGVGIALDDFGTGYSSLSYLKRLPIDALKLDQGFVAGLPADRHDLAIVQAIAGLAKNIGIDIVAEGVENEAQAQALRDCGIVRAQGHLFAPALAEDALLEAFGDRV